MKTFIKTSNAIRAWLLLKGHTISSKKHLRGVVYFALLGDMITVPSYRVLKRAPADNCIIHIDMRSKEKHHGVYGLSSSNIDTGFSQSTIGHPTRIPEVVSFVSRNNINLPITSTSSRINKPQ